jgi:hypothetical protein
MDLRHACWWWIFYEEEEEEEEEIGGVGEEKDLEQEEMGQKENLGVLQSGKFPAGRIAMRLGLSRVLVIFWASSSCRVMWKKISMYIKMKLRLSGYIICSLKKKDNY